MGFSGIAGAVGISGVSSIGRTIGGVCKAMPSEGSGADANGAAGSSSLGRSLSKDVGGSSRMIGDNSVRAIYRERRFQSICSGNTGSVLSALAGVSVGASTAGGAARGVVSARGISVTGGLICC